MKELSSTESAGDAPRPPAPNSFAGMLARLDKEALARRVVVFAVPVAAALAIAATMNHARFHTWNPNAFGHEYLAVQWRDRMAKWGLFGWHFLAKNLGVSLTILPWLPPHGESCFALPDAGPLYILGRFKDCVPFRVNEHGLALWWTTPLYLWLFRPGPRTPGENGSRWQYGALLASAAVIAAMDLFYQNSGWRQFGFRFSNDFAPVLFLLLAMGIRNMKSFWFQLAVVWAVAWNLFGAVTFDRQDWDRFYFREGTQQILYQAD